MSDRQNEKRVPKKETGLVHLLHSTQYSSEGLKRLLKEAAFRQELVAFFAVIGWHLLLGSPIWLWIAQIVGALVLFTVEAINTAVEELVDHVSPGYSTAAKHAKDLGSFAVASMLLANGLIALTTVLV